ncbi:MAG: dynamin family protein [Chitinispirillales bacterium]|jgi:GTPase Era involved in 16S rRNA processing|nr:dynamin family protein [Chitinispirillales bacterium]
MLSLKNDINVAYDHDFDDYSAEPVSFDESVRRALAFCDTLPDDFAPQRRQLAELQTRLSGGRLHFAVLGQFNRGKSTFINALLGIKALPASVLPLTSVPTVVEYGVERACRIRFLDGREDLAISGGSEDNMAQALRQYVAEENNPKNIHRVRDAIITCQSELLANGTVLIDTPGFGSTYLHNTQTTLDMLIECDAALFLLSADPPMTQTELEFLRDVKERVPKIFFVLNKADLLTRQGLSEVDAFIKNLLRRELGFPIDTPLYHTSAVKGERAAQACPSDPHWAASGLEEVKRETLDFMIREKYFTLADALQSKYAQAADAIETVLSDKLNEKLAPINALREGIGTITNAIQALSLELGSVVKMCTEEKEKLNAKIDVWTVENKESYTMSMKKALSVLINGKYFPEEAASIASTLLPKHAYGLGEQFLNTVIGFANKSVRLIAVRHAETFARLHKRYAVHFGNNSAWDMPEPKPAEELIERLEIGSLMESSIFDSAPWDIPYAQMAGLFRKKTAKFEAIRDFYESLCEEKIVENINKAAKIARAQTNTAWEKMQETINTPYRQLIDRLSALYRVKQEILEAEEEKAKQDIAFWKGRIREFKSIVVPL